ncbi:DUF1330 domain-containing protein [Blastococcus sp. Marseille-P5729]|uniref:DUF1330 domain-containing protein n=1 Tax=Blastococcus sp. Marseille-P5729 TaxID=2086582 RepID=UPI000D107EA3
MSPTPALREYLSKVDATLDAFDARIVAQTQPVTLKGRAPQRATIVEFPTEQPAYRRS